MSAASDLTAIQAITARLQTSHPSQWGYTPAAYSGDEIEGVPSFNFANDMNVPDLTALFTNPNVTKWGNQTQAASIARALLNHMFGRLSYNLRKLTDKFYEMMSITKRQWSLNAFAYDTNQDYYQGDVCWTSAVVSGVQLITYYIRTSGAPLTINGIVPTNTTHWTIVQQQSAVFPQQSVNAPGYRRSYSMIDLSNTGTYAANTWFPVVFDSLTYSLVATPYDANTILTLFEAYVAGSVSGQANACRASLSAMVKTGRWNVASTFDTASYPTGATILDQLFIDDTTGADLGLASSPIGMTMLPKGQQVVLWLRGGSKYQVWNSFGASYSVKTASYNNPAGDPAVAPQTARQFAYNPAKQWGRFAVPTPVVAEDAVNKTYVDTSVNALFGMFGIPPLYPANGATLTKNAVSRTVRGTKTVVLPVGATDGEFVEIDASEAQVIITQGTANDLVRMPGVGYSTVGVTGQTIIPQGFFGLLVFVASWFSINIVPPVKIANPANLPASDGFGASWSPDGRYLAIVHTTTPFVTIYDWSTGSPMKIANPATLPTGNGLGVAWSPDGRYLAIAHTSSPYVTIYDWSTGSPVKITNPATLPVSDSYGVTWSPDGKFLAVAHLLTPFCTIYDWGTGSPVKITNPATLPTGNAFGTAWSPDGRYLAVVHTTTPFVTIYDWSTSTPVKIANPATLPANVAEGLAWSPDGRFLTIANSNTPFITIYDWITGAPVARTANPATLPTGNTVAAAWSPDGRYMAIAMGYANSPYVMVYDWVTSVPIKITDPAILPASSVRGLAWSPDGRYLAVAHATAPFVTIYDWGVVVTNAWKLIVTKSQPTALRVFGNYLQQFRSMFR